jgi:tetratricopeptide (TPR) repeat protein
MASERIEKSVFISYRRTNFPWALAIFQKLQACGYDVFLDFAGIASGDFEQVILGNIRARAHFLVLLTPSAVEHFGEPGDWMRREIEAAIECKRNIVPLMLENFDFDTPSIAQHLTGKLELLKRYNGIEIPVQFFDYAMRHLQEKFLNVPLSAVLHPVTSAIASVTEEQRKAAIAASQVRQEELTAQQWYERGSDVKNVDEKIKCFGEAIRLKPDFTGALICRCFLRSVKGDNEGAIRDGDEAIRLEPNNAIAFNCRGQARYNKGDLDGAIKDYDEAIRLSPDYAGAFNNRCVARGEKDDFKGMIADCDKAIRLEPDNAVFLFNRGSARSKYNDYKNAIKDFSEAIRLRPDYAEAYLSRGIAKNHKKDFEGAIADFDEAIRLKPDYAEVFYMRGQYVYIRGMDRNISGLKYSIKNDLRGKSELDGARADYQNALRDFDEAIRINPNFAEAYHSRGSVKKQLEDQQGAQQDFEQAKKLGYRP